MDAIPGPATGAFLTALQMCQVRGYRVHYEPYGNLHVYAVIRPNKIQRLVYSDQRGLAQVLQFLEEENGTKTS